MLVDVALIATDASDSVIPESQSPPVPLTEHTVTHSPPATASLSVPPKEIWVFSRQLSLMQGAGAPLLASLKTLAQQTENLRFAIVLASIAASIEQGESLSQALNKFPQTFPPIYRALVREGEEAGHLASSFNRAAELLEKEQILRYRCFSALLYPVLVLVLGSTFGLCAFYFMIPFLLELFADQSMSLPLPTQLLLGLSWLLSQKPFVLTVALFVLAALAVLPRLLKSPQWTERRDRWLVRAPVLGRLVRLACVVRILPTLATTMESGIPLTLCLELCSESAGNDVFRRDLLVARRKLIRGVPLEKHFAEKGWLYGPAFLAVLNVGLESGSLGHGCERLLRLLNIELDVRLEQFVALLQPAVLLLTGGAVAFLCIATLQPLASLMP